MKRFIAIGLAGAGLLLAITISFNEPRSNAGAADDVQQAGSTRVRPLREQTDEELRQQVAELRRKLPYQSVAPRLKYESRIPKSKPRLSRETNERLDALEKAYAGESGATMCGPNRSPHCTPTKCSNLCGKKEWAFRG